MITLVTVTYNAEKELKRTLESVKGQTYGDYEHLIIDGASTDGTVGMALRYRDGARKGQVVVISEKDNGLYDAMNKALDIAKGDFICFMNAGDTLHSTETLQHVANAAKGKKDKVGIIYGHTDIVDETGRFLRSRRLQPPTRLTWRSFKEGMLVCHQSFYVNRTIAQKYDLGYRFSADIDWCIRCMKEGEKRGMENVFVAEPLSDFLAAGMTTRNHKASLGERFRIMQKHYGLMATIAMHLWFVVRAVFKN